MNEKSTYDEDKRKFDQVVNLIKKLANRISRTYHKNFDDMYEVGLEYYVWTLQHYKADKGAKFSTYLYQQVYERMVDECLKQNRQMPLLYTDVGSEFIDQEDFSLDDIVADDRSMEKEREENRDKLRKLAKESLSYEGFMVFDWIVSHSWAEINNQPLPSKTVVKKALKLSTGVIQMAWNEIECFWANVSPKLMMVA